MSKIVEPNQATLIRAPFEESQTSPITYWGKRVGTTKPEETGFDDLYRCLSLEVNEKLWPGIKFTGEEVEAILGLNVG